MTYSSSKQDMELDDSSFFGSSGTSCSSIPSNAGSANTGTYCSSSKTSSRLRATGKTRRRFGAGGASGEPGRVCGGVCGLWSAISNQI